MSKRKKQAPNDLSSDIVEHEEYGVVADEESNARSNASGETVMSQENRVQLNITLAVLVS
jgi:hypothetical protein